MNGYTSLQSRQISESDKEVGDPCRPWPLLSFDPIEILAIRDQPEPPHSDSLTTVVSIGLG